MRVTYERVRELFYYNGKDLVWKASRKGVMRGTSAGGVTSSGYKYIGIDRTQYLAHRLIWLFHYGYFPEHQIDHINRDRLDNRIGNLREVSCLCNLKNRGPQKCNITGIKGVVFSERDKRYYARIGVNRKGCYLGSFKNLIDAVLVRYAAEQCLGWESCDSMSTAHEYALNNNLVSK